MMRGLFVQGMAVLFRDVPSVDQVSAALRAFGDDVRRRPAGEAKKQPNWIAGYEGWIVPFRPELNGVAVVEVIDAPWPDHMGDPKSGSAADKMLFGAWTMGFMTPGAWPGMLERAAFVAGPLGDAPAAQAAREHRAFVRILLSYATGDVPGDAPIHPPGRDARAEFDFCLRIVEALLTVPGAAAYFNPAGTLVMSPQRFTQLNSDDSDLPPVPLATMPRKVQLDAANPSSSSSLMELTGLWQLRDDVPDVSAVLAPPYKASDVVNMLLGVAGYLVASGPVIADGHTIDGPGGRWRAKRVEESETPPPRPVLLFSPDTRGAGGAGGAPYPGKRGMFSRLFGR